MEETRRNSTDNTIQGQREGAGKCPELVDIHPRSSSTSAPSATSTAAATIATTRRLLCVLARVGAWRCYEDGRAAVLCKDLVRTKFSKNELGVRRVRS